MIIIMREVNLAGVDLNLLPALEALIRRRNVTRAAADVGLSQPAMSRALARLRALVGDPILVKAPGGLAPTARAAALLPHLTGALDRLGGVIHAPDFQPETLDRAFHIAAADVQAVLLGPPLLAAMRARAPRASLRFVPVGADVRERIESGDLDACPTSTPNWPKPGWCAGSRSRPRIFWSRSPLSARPIASRQCRSRWRAASRRRSDYKSTSRRCARRGTR